MIDHCTSFQQPIPADYTPITITDVARRIGVTPAAVIYHQQRNRIPLPTVRIGARLYYCPLVADAIVKWFEDRAKLRHGIK